MLNMPELLQAVGDETGNRPHLVEAAKLLRPDRRVGGQFPGRYDDIVPRREIAAARLERADDRFDLVAVDVEYPDATGGRRDLERLGQRAVVRIGSGGVSIDIEHAEFQVHLPAGGDVRAHLLAHAHRGEGVADKSERNCSRGGNYRHWRMLQSTVTPRISSGWHCGSPQATDARLCGPVRDGCLRPIRSRR